MAFRLPPPVRPTFDPRMMGGDEMPTVTALDQPPPMPKMAAPPMPAPPPPPNVSGNVSSTSARQELLQQEMPPMPKMSGWRGYVAAGLNGGVPGLVSHALNPNFAQQRAEYATRQQWLKDRADAEHTLKQEELTETQRKAYAQSIKNQEAARLAADADRDEAREQGYLREGWRDVAPGSVLPPAMPGMPQRTEATQVGGRLRQRTTEYGKALEKNEADALVLPEPIATALKLPVGQKVPKSDFDAYSRMYQAHIDNQNKTPEAQMASRTKIADQLGINGRDRQVYIATGRIERPASEGGSGGGSFQPLVNERGEVTSFFNPKTGENVPPPMPGARKAPLPAGEADKRAVMEVMFENTGTLAQLGEKHSAVIGRVKGALTDIERKNLGVDESVNDLFRISDDMADQLLRARSGAAITEPEYVRMRALMPDPRAPLSKFKSDLRLFRDGLRQLYKAKTGRDLGGSTPAPVGESVKPIVQRSKSTGQYRHSLDGGKTWQPGQPK